MSFADPIAAGNTLVRDALQSEGFIAGTTGWRVQKTGNAEFNNVTMRGDLTLPGSTAPMEIKIYNSAGNPVVQITDGAGRTYVMLGGAGSGGLTIGEFGAANPQLRWRQDAAASFDSLWAVCDSPVNGNLTGWGLEPETGYLRYHSAHTFETYVNLGLNNGWTNYGGPGPYAPLRALRSADGFVHIEGTIVPGTTVDGTLVAVLPIGYRPQTYIRRIPLMEKINTNMMADIAPNGQITVIGTAGTTTVSFCSQFPVI